MFSKVAKYLLSEYPVKILLVASMMLASGLLEGFSVAAIVPLIGSSGWLFQSENTLLKLFAKFFDVVNVEVSPVNVLLLILILIMLKALLNIARQIMTKAVQIGYEVSSKQKISEQIINSETTYLFRQDFGKIVNVANQETRLISNLVVYAASFINSIIMIVVYIALLLVISWRVTVMTVIAGVLVYFLLYGFYIKGRELGSKLAQTRSLIMNGFQNALNGHRLIRSYILEKRLVSKLRDYFGQLREYEIKISVLESIQGSFYEPLVVVLGVTAIGLFKMPVGLFIVFLAGLMRMYTAVRNIQNTHYKIAVFTGSLDMFDEVSEGLACYQTSSGSGLYKFGVFSKSIDIVNVEYAYNSSSGGFRLGPLSMSIKQGDIVAIVGKSGSGKSTMTDLMLGLLRPTAGSIIIDEVNMNDLDITSLRKKVSYVEQEPFIFNDTVMNNITLYEEGYSINDVKEACKISCIDEFIEGLSSEYEALMGEGGTSFSGGQKQRIALARALIRKPEIIVLDEATSALDYELEKNIHEVLKSLHGRITIILVAHRLTTIKNADVIYVFEHGRIVECGRFDELVELNGNFTKLCNGGLGSE